MPLAARLPRLWTPARSPNADPSHVDSGVRRDGGVFGGFDAADADAGEREPWQQGRPAVGVVGEAEVGDGEGGDPEGEHASCSGAVGVLSGGEAGEGGGDVVGM